MPRMLADGSDMLLWVADGGIADITAVSVGTELSAAVDLSFLVSKQNFNLGPTGDNVINDAPLASDDEVTAPGITQFNLEMDFYRYDVPAEDIPWSTFTGKGVAGFLVHRFDVDYATAIAAADVVNVYQVIAGTPMILNATGDGGYRKFRQKFHQQAVALRSALVA